MPRNSCPRQCGKWYRVARWALASGSPEPGSPLYDKVILYNNPDMSTGRSSRVFTISFPEDLARQVEETAKEESRNVSELFREAFRTYRMERARRRLQADLEYAQTRNREGFGPNDIEEFVDQIRQPRLRKRKVEK
jgi:hypothetical protein